MNGVGTWIVPALEDILRKARTEERRARAAVRYADTKARVAAFLEEHPGASANAVYREVGGRRADVLRATRDVRQRFPAHGNHQNAGAP